MSILRTRVNEKGPNGQDKIKKGYSQCMFLEQKVIKKRSNK